MAVMDRCDGCGVSIDYGDPVLVQGSGESMIVSHDTPECSRAAARNKRNESRIRRGRANIDLGSLLGGSGERAGRDDAAGAV